MGVEGPEATRRDNGSQLAKDIRPLFRDTLDVDSMKEYGLDLSSYEE